VIKYLRKNEHQRSKHNALYSLEGGDFSFALSYFNFMNNDPTLSKLNAPAKATQRSIITEKKVIRNRLEEIVSM